jgi:hypothetical protein
MLRSHTELLSAVSCLGPRLAAISHQPASLLFTGWLSTELPCWLKSFTHEPALSTELSLTIQLHNVASLDWTADNCSQQLTRQESLYESICFGIKRLETHNQRFFFHLNSCGNSPYVTSSLTRRWVCLVWTCWAFHQGYISHIQRVFFLYVWGGSESLGIFVSSP